MTVLLTTNFIFISISYLIVMARTSGTISNKGSNSEQPRFFVYFIRNAPIFHFLLVQENLPLFLVYHI